MSFLFHGLTAMLPVRWMSPESIREGLFTPCTDVWSYGVTLWELSTIGGFPYQGMSNAEVSERVEKGYTLELPSQSSPEMYVSLIDFLKEIVFVSCLGHLASDQ